MSLNFCYECNLWQSFKWKCHFTNSKVPWLFLSQSKRPVHWNWIGYLRKRVRLSPASCLTNEIPAYIQVSLVSVIKTPDIAFLWVTWPEQIQRWPSQRIPVRRLEIGLEISVYIVTKHCRHDSVLKHISTRNMSSVSICMVHPLAQHISPTWFWVNELCNFGFCMMIDIYITNNFSIRMKSFEVKWLSIHSVVSLTDFDFDNVWYHDTF